MYNQKLKTPKDFKNYFEEHKQKFCPSIEDFSLKFAKDVLKGNKKLLNLKDIYWI